MISLNVKSLLFTLALVAGIIALNPAVFLYPFSSNVTSQCFAEDTVNITFMDTRIREELSLKKNMINFNKASGLLHTALKEQKRVFTAKKGNETNKTALKIEDLMNEANLFASQRSFKKGFKVLETVHGMMMTSLKELLRK
jgi:hypothetical protein